jgi:hypothetical protein
MGSELYGEGTIKELRDNSTTKLIKVLISLFPNFSYRFSGRNWTFYRKKPNFNEKKNPTSAACQTILPFIFLKPRDFSFSGK